ncbi:acriflavin resistance protein [Pirellula staleyi DSM 6068]|uniref:Acriflavin resistance protein n=1 Tax=Pirellula staleyi (strain ATCC 27377 / DSM 6068 / ICPB 4128) TaxID=530564 RepID=D2R972_PIRSD|nr:acriflavin resistance protein [Pirellula staleyi DSM 6068]
MNPVIFAMRRPLTIVVGIIAILLAAGVAVRPKSVDQYLSQYGVELPLKRMPVDIFPALNLPVIYVCQPYGGMDPAQMEGLITNYYEYHFLYISGIHHVESKNVQGNALMKLYFHPGTNMAQAMAETINYVNRSRAFMPPGTVSPFVMRFDTGSVPVGYLVLSSETRTIAEIQDIALFKVRPLFSALPGVSAPPPFGGSARTVVLRVSPDKLRAYGVSADDVINALVSGNTISPSGNLHVGNSYPIVPMNAMVRDPKELGTIPIKVGANPAVYLSDLAEIVDAADISAGYALVNGRRAVYILATKRADASTMSVIDEIKRALPSMQKELPDDIRVSFEFDQSPYVTRAIDSLLHEGALGALLTGLMVLVFLRDWRSALVVVLNIPLAIAAAVVGLWICGQTINLMTLGGLALAVGILVDEATVEIENIHSQLDHTDSVALAVRRGNSQTAIPRLLAMLCILAVFVPSFFMTGAARELFVPLSLAVGFSMIASYILSSTFVPILSTWLLQHHSHSHAEQHGHRSEGQPGSSSRNWFAFNTYRDFYGTFVSGMVAARWIVIPAYLAASLLTIGVVGSQIGIEIFPQIDAGEFRLRFRAKDGTHIEETERIALGVLDHIGQKVGPENVDITLGYVGMIHSNFPINAVYQFSRGPEEAILRIALKPHTGIRTEVVKEELRTELAQKFPQVRFSFEPADIVSEVMSFGSPTPIEIAARGGSVAENRAFLGRVTTALAELPELRDVQLYQSLDYPTVDVKLDRIKAGRSGVTTSQVARSVLAATASSRFVVPNYWPDPKSGVGYQVQVEVPQPFLTSIDQLGAVPVRQSETPLLLRDVASISEGTTPGQYDRYNMKREVSLTANLAGTDLGRTSARLETILKRVQAEYDAEREVNTQNGVKPAAISYEIRGQIPPMKQMISGLGIGLLLAILVIYLLLTANFQSLGLALVAVSTAPAVVAGSLVVLLLSGSTLNIQSFIGMIMAIGVAMANAILLITFAEQARREGAAASTAAIEGGKQRLRAILMTSLAMLSGMLPMALAFGEAGQQTAPLGRAVMGGLIAATFSTLVVLPSLFAFVQSRATRASASLDPGDAGSRHFVPGTEEA